MLPADELFSAITNFPNLKIISLNLIRNIGNEHLKMFHKLSQVKDPRIRFLDSPGNDSLDQGLLELVRLSPALESLT